MDCVSVLTHLALKWCAVLSENGRERIGAFWSFRILVIPSQSIIKSLLLWACCFKWLLWKNKIILGYCDRCPQSSTFSPSPAQLLSTYHLQYQQSWMQFQLCKNCSKLEKTGDQGLIPGSGRSPGEGNGNQLQYTFLENPMDTGAWQVTVHGAARVGHNLVTKPSQKRLVTRDLVTAFVSLPI